MKPILVSKKGLLLLIVVGVSLICLGGLFKLNGVEAFADVILISGLITNLIAWGVILSDVLQNNIPYKSLWILALVFVPGIAMFVYVVKRDELIQVRVE